MIGLPRRKVDSLRGVGKARALALGRLGLETVEDLLFMVPRYYENWTQAIPISAVQPGEVVCLQGRITGLVERKTRQKGLVITEALLRDDSGDIGLIWFLRVRSGQSSYIRRQLALGQEILVYGRAEQDNRRLVIRNPQWKRPTQLEGNRLIPVYPLTEGITQAQMRNYVGQALRLCRHDIGEFLPENYRRSLSLPERWAAIRGLHRAGSREEADAARRRLAFDELLCLQLALRIRRKQAEKVPGVVHSPDGALVQKFLGGLPYRLTAAQRKVMSEIAADMESPTVMQRLLQGDVGSGKTVVALYALIKSVEAGYQAVMMVPTEILAEQHYRQVVKAVQPLGIKTGLLTGALTDKEKENLRWELAAGQCQLVVGTHALLQPDVDFQRLGLVVIDEQHRFGVAQRQALVQKGNPDVLVMTATPIPRTLALAVYGDLDVSLIDELPPGRKPVDTRWISPADRERVYRFIRRQVEAGHQAYIVYPLVEESEAVTARAASNEVERLRKTSLAGLEIGLLHGQLTAAEKDRVMEDFAAGRLHVLVTTTVIEVGVDVPNASVMVVENAERFGLAQLHQLRGRVGRGSVQAYCLLIGNPSTPSGKQRLHIIRQTNDGFALAEADLKLRGPGELLGTRQSGLSELRIADLVEDLPLLEEAARLARSILASDPDLTAPHHRALREELYRRHAMVWMVGAG